MINNHINFLNRVSVNATINFKKEIKEYLIVLKHFPKVGQKIYLSGKQMFQARRLIIKKRYMLVYIIVKNNIYINDVIDVRQSNIYK